VRAQNSLKFSTDAHDGCLRAQVARVGVQADTQHIPNLKGVREHEQLGLGIRGGADGRGCKPGVADLADVGIATAVARVAGGPSPALYIEEAC
jgi:hypothetical protein